MASTKQTMKLYWITTQDHYEDWFIFAESARQARAYHEDYEGYGKGDARSRLIVRDVRLTKFTNGEPPCPAQMRELFALGFEDAGSVPNQRSMRFEGKTYTEGIQESMAVTLRENGSLQLKEASSSRTEPDGVTGVETGLRLVN
jgi:hypothetical protein